MPKDLEISRLCDAYGALLTDNMCRAVREYYDYDMSLAEIGEEFEITRQAVLCRLRQAEGKLKEFEAAIGMVKRSDEVCVRLQDALSVIYARPDEAKRIISDAVRDLRDMR